MVGGPLRLPFIILEARRPTVGASEHGPTGNGKACLVEIGRVVREK
jgi:hypothetical protein